MIMVLGLATLVADALSMSVSAYLSEIAQAEMAEAERKEKLKILVDHPELVTKQLIEMYRERDYTELEAEKLVHILMLDSQTVLDTLGFLSKDINQCNHLVPYISGLYTFLSFIIFGLIPVFCDMLLQFTRFSNNPLMTACSLTALTLFCLGCAKASIIGKEPIHNGIQLVTIGGFAALSAYFVAFFVSSFGH
eukprot:TRINITY_DN3557_c0_g1_i3.p1 TRINITY_DN3557_c0_g1~~TRINITY_DN3557_c0_g1_i3.p1  ORF type:complete len:193 (-),score=23.59 TRINITY_DN3557_c0_g1_i3:215-793(-)